MHRREKRSGQNRESRQGEHSSLLVWIRSRFRIELCLALSTQQLQASGDGPSFSVTVLFSIEWDTTHDVMVRMT